MKNKLGEDGVINLDGKLGSEAQLLSVDDPDFFNAIELEIRQTVKVIIENGFVTYSSCQGHHSPLYSLRNVVVVLPEQEIDYWRAMIAEINILNQFSDPISYSIVDYRNDKKGLMIIFGSIFQLKETVLKQKCFEEYIPLVKSNFYNKKHEDIVDFTNKFGHINVFH